MPSPIKFFACDYCREIHDTEISCREHEAGCAWNCPHLTDPSLRACPSCDGCKTVATGFCCTSKGNAMIPSPVTLCRWYHRNRPATAPVPDSQAQEARA